MSTTQTPAASMPPLRWYSHTWRLGLCLLISAATWSSSWQGQWNHHRALFWIDLSVGLLALALSFLRRRWPFTIALALAAMGSVSAAAFGPAVLAAVSFATRRKVGRIALLGSLLILASQVYTHSQPMSPNSGVRISRTDDTGRVTDSSGSSTSTYLDLATDLVLTSAILGWGMYIGSRRELLWTLRDRAERAETEQALRVANARASERARIAREMHDVVAHRISLVSMQSGAMAFRGDLDIAQLRGGAEQIQSQANLALTELRGVLGVLRSSEDAELLLRPQPTYGDIGALIAESVASGMHIEFLDLVDSAADVPEAAGRTAYRIVQEGLTNARKHAPGALVRVRLSGSPQEGIDVLIRNPLGFTGTATVPSSGLGLIGLAERAALSGGRLEHGQEATTFTLHGWIPWGP